MSSKKTKAGSLCPWRYIDHWWGRIALPTNHIETVLFLEWCFQSSHPIWFWFDGVHYGDQLSKRYLLWTSCLAYHLSEGWKNFTHFCRTLAYDRLSAHLLMWKSDSSGSCCPVVMKESPGQLLVGMAWSTKTHKKRFMSHLLTRL